MTYILNESILSKKSEMYAMIIAIETDFICNFRDHLILADIPQKNIQHANPVSEESGSLLAVLRGMDIQDYIEICNANINKLNINATQKYFINIELSKIIPIRNAVMHPRPIGFYDHAIISHAFEEIDKALSCFTWENAKRTRIQISEHPETLIPPPSTLKKSNRIYENLPILVDYEETSFIGRRKEIGELKAQLNRRNVNILSVIGDGGVGKTALTLKLLYDLLDDETCPFEVIIWASLKTNELSNNDFAAISNSIRTTAGMYEKLAKFVGSIPTDDTKHLIIELAQNFNTLFVLDNLETINTAEIKGFFDEFSEYGKVLITSRIGLGEMEHRYKLNGLGEQDVIDYTNTLLSLYGFECLYTNEQRKQIFQEELHSNPLAIKWFVRCLYNGQDTETILGHKEDVINFCMANVYENLSKDARDVLDILTVANVELSYPELMYYMNSSAADIVKISYAINELGKCNFIDDAEFKINKKIAITSFAHEFLQLHFIDTRHLLAMFKEKQKQLLSFGQQLLIKKSQEQYNLNSIHYSNKGELVSAYYLDSALKFALPKGSNIERALELVNYAKLLTPSYFECNLILAVIHAHSSPLKATAEYEQAIKNCKTDEDLILTYIKYADFLITVNDYYSAIDVLCKAQAINENCIEVKFEKAKALSYIGEYDKVDKLLNEIEAFPLSQSESNKLLTKRADLLRRRSELIDIRETQKRLELLKMAFNYLESSVVPDRLLEEYMVTLLIDALYLYFDNDALDFVYEKVHKHFQNIRGLPIYKTFRGIALEKEQVIENNDFKRNISKYVIDYNNQLALLNQNEGVVYNILQGYGFCKNREYPTGLFFSMTSLPKDITYGDIISYSAIYTSKGRTSAVHPKRVGCIEERLGTDTIK